MRLADVENLKGAVMQVSVIRRISAFAMLLGTTIPLVEAQVASHSAVMEVIHGKPYVMVTLNGKGPFRFIIDTGTGGDAIITPELADELALPAAGSTHLSDPTGVGGQTAPLLMIVSLRVAGVEFTAVKAVRHRLPGDEGSCQGMLGFTLFRNLLLTLDYVNGRVTLATGALTPDNEKSVLPFRMPDGVPVASMRIGSLRVDAQIDSGGAGLSLPEHLASAFKFSARPELIGKGESLSTRFEIKAGKLAPDVRVGEYTLSSPWVEINPAFPLANFGSAPMQHFAITFDQHNLLMRLEGPRKRITLGVTPTPMRLAHVPSYKQADIALIPVG
jgi:hypothetical protein